MKTLDDALSTPGVIEGVKFQSVGLFETVVQPTRHARHVEVHGILSAEQMRRIADHLDPQPVSLTDPEAAYSEIAQLIQSHPNMSVLTDSGAKEHRASVVQAIRKIIGVSAPVIADARSMHTAPRDRTPILVRFKDRLAHIRPDLKNWEGRYCVVSHPGWTVDGFDVGWGMAAPVGYGGIPDEWLAGWMHLPVAAPSSVQEKPDNADCSKISNGLEVHDDSGRCRANRDGECSWSGCPQLRDGEPHKSGRHCPRDIGREGEDD